MGCYTSRCIDLDAIKPNTKDMPKNSINRMISSIDHKMEKMQKDLEVETELIRMKDEEIHKLKEENDEYRTHNYSNTSDGVPIIGTPPKKSIDRMISSIDHKMDNIEKNLELVELIKLKDAEILDLRFENEALRQRILKLEDGYKVFLN